MPTPAIASCGGVGRSIASVTESCDGPASAIKRECLSRWPALPRGRPATLRVSLRVLRDRSPTRRLRCQPTAPSKTYFPSVDPFTPQSPNNTSTRKVRRARGDCRPSLRGELTFDGRELIKPARLGTVAVTDPFVGVAMEKAGHCPAICRIRDRTFQNAQTARRACWSLWTSHFALTTSHCASFLRHQRRL